MSGTFRLRQRATETTGDWQWQQMLERATNTAWARSEERSETERSEGCIMTPPSIVASLLVYSW